ncbi:hypothetical protein AVEN_226861-1 [Araneus ventricosus]|uniref:Uncharacterized protein n=1 Tax=Araneus ventricosus TaxID=182803 RepID=A0A4Y2H5L0_ARAVE|nr:hypothetical protein AVEN_226861-1 [Araneus ventricosus]
MGGSDKVLPELLQDVPIAIRNRMWFRHDGAPTYFSIDVRNYLNYLSAQSLLWSDGLSVVDQSFGHPDLPIYRASITFYGDI